MNFHMTKSIKRTQYAGSVFFTLTSHLLVTLWFLVASCLFQRNEKLESTKRTTHITDKNYEFFKQKLVHLQFVFFFVVFFIIQISLFFVVFIWSVCVLILRGINLRNCYLHFLVFETSSHTNTYTETVWLPRRDTFRKETKKKCMCRMEKRKKNIFGEMENAYLSK